MLIVVAMSLPVRAQTPDHEAVDRAWAILKSGLRSEHLEERTTTARVLGLIEDDREAGELALAALADKEANVRSAAADALGQMNARAAVPRLVEAIKTDREVSVVIAAARGLIALGEPLGYAVYYAVLTGERKSGGGLLESQKKMLKDPKKMAQFGFEQGIGFIPFAGIGYGAIRAVKTDDTSPVRAAAAKILARDADPKSLEALLEASSDASWMVRAAALDALSHRSDPTVVPRIASRLDDDKNVVRYTAAAAIVHLHDVEIGGGRPESLR